MSNNRRVQEIIERLNALTLEANALSMELRALNQQTEATNPYQVGDRVTITNNYRWKKGTKGVVVCTTATQVTLKDANGNLHKRKHTNVEHTINQED